jgi:hypothetical protein
MDVRPGFRGITRLAGGELLRRRDELVELAPLPPHGGDSLRAPARCPPRSTLPCRGVAAPQRLFSTTISRGVPSMLSSASSNISFDSFDVGRP